MAIICQVCSKKPVSGHKVSHSNVKSKRRWYPNLQRIKVQLADGTKKFLSVCTRCIRSGKINKAL